MKIYNLPNSLTISRLIALPFCAYALFKNGGDDSTWRIIAWTGFFLVGLTDFFDGKIARSRKQVTSFGAFLDPVAEGKRSAFSNWRSSAFLDPVVRMIPGPVHGARIHVQRRFAVHKNVVLDAAIPAAADEGARVTL